MAWNTSTVTIGNSTKKGDYDRLRSNDQMIASSTFTFNGVKTFGNKTNFYSPTATATSLGTCHIFRSVKYSLSNKAVKNPTLVWKSSTALTYLPSGTTAILARVDYINHTSLKDMNFRSDSINGYHLETVRGIPNNLISNDVILRLDSNLKYYYYCGSQYTGTCSIQVRGYYV